MDVAAKITSRMTFQELHLLMAMRRVSELGRDRPTTQQRTEFARRVHDEWVHMTGDVQFPFSTDDVIRLSLNMRKNKNNKIKADIAVAHGAACFWRGRNKGPCCNEVEAGHLVPNCVGGALTVANGIIECRSHNNQRRELTIEEYLQSDKVTR